MHSPHSLVGRDRDLAFVRAFLAEAAEQGGALLITGDAGVGKSVVLDRVAADCRRAGVQVLRATGAEFDAALSFSGLSQLLQPVLGRLDELEELHAQALRVALGLAGGRASEELAVAAATLRLLAVAADLGPLAIV